jgi:hypothetical protein
MRTGILVVFSVLIGLCQHSTAQQPVQWIAKGRGDCGGKDVACSVGVQPDPNRCSSGTVGQTAICFESGANTSFPLCVPTT